MYIFKINMKTILKMTIYHNIREMKFTLHSKKNLKYFLLFTTFYQLTNSLHFNSKYRNKSTVQKFLWTFQLLKKSQILEMFHKTEIFIGIFGIPLLKLISNVIPNRKKL